MDRYKNTVAMNGKALIIHYYYGHKNEKGSVFYVRTHMKKCKIIRIMIAVDSNTVFPVTTQSLISSRPRKLERSLTKKMIPHYIRFLYMIIKEENR